MVEGVRDSYPGDLLWRGLPPQVVESYHVLNQVVRGAALPDLLALSFPCPNFHREADLVLAPDLRRQVLIDGCFLWQGGEVVIGIGLLPGGRVHVRGRRFLIFDHGGDPILQLQMLLEA